MVKLWNRRTAPSQADFVSNRSRLQELSGDLLRKYRADIDKEIHDPERLEAMYGSQFANGNATRQAQTIVQMASDMLKVPNAAIHIVLPDRQETVACVGGDPVDVASEDSYCRNVIGTGREFAVTNTRGNVLVCDSRVTTELGIMSYLGVPIANLEGIIVGVLCVYDFVQRDWSPADVGILTQLSFVLTRATATDAQQPA